MQFAVYLHEAVIHHFHCIVFCIAIPHADSHREAIIHFIKCFLKLPVCFYTALDDMDNAARFWQNLYFYYSLPNLTLIRKKIMNSCLIYKMYDVRRLMYDVKKKDPVDYQSNLNPSLNSSEIYYLFIMPGIFPMGILFIIFIMLFICSNCFKNWFNSARSFPLPFAIRALRDGLIRSGLRRS